MKKIFNIIAITLITITITGCIHKNAEITCTKTDETIIITRKYNKIVKVITESTNTYENETILNSAHQIIQTKADVYNQLKGTKAEITKNNNTLTLKITFDVTNMNREVIDEEDFDESPREFIEDLKEDGYTCK